MHPEPINPAVPDRKGYVVFFILVFFLLAYASFLTWDVVTHGHGSLYTVVLKYGSILLTFFLTLIIGKDDHDLRDRTFLQLAFLFSAIGDFFLIIMNWFFSAQSGTWFMCGMAAFFVTQIMLTIRHSRDFVWNKIEVISAVIIYGFVASIMIYLIPYIETALLLPILIYALALTTSLWMGIGTLWRPYISHDHRRDDSLRRELFLYVRSKRRPGRNLYAVGAGDHRTRDRPGVGSAARDSRHGHPGPRAPGLARRSGGVVRDHHVDLLLTRAGVSEYERIQTAFSAQHRPDTAAVAAAVLKSAAYSS